MTEKNISLRKKKRIQISNLDDFKLCLENEGFSISNLSDYEFEKMLLDNFNLEISALYSLLNTQNITFKAYSLLDFIEYIKNINIFYREHYTLCKKISKINKLIVERVEYEREECVADDVSLIINDIDNTKNKVSFPLSSEDKGKLSLALAEIEKDNIYTKDIELLKKMLTSQGTFEEVYNSTTKVKRIEITLPNKICPSYIKSELGSLEYHTHLKNIIPRLKRLIKNLHKYLEPIANEPNSFKINQTNIIQDTVNLAIATYDDHDFKAISGSNDIESFCQTIIPRKAVFKSLKVNKLGHVGTGYNRVNDSEKKILEEIHKGIESKNLENHGTLIMYTKWEPCPSCYYVISQFSKLHPNVNIKVKYGEKYGEEVKS